MKSYLQTRIAIERRCKQLGCIFTVLLFFVICYYVGRFIAEQEQRARHSKAIIYLEDL